LTIRRLKNGCGLWKVVPACWRQNVVHPKQSSVFTRQNLRSTFGELPVFRVQKNRRENGRIGFGHIQINGLKMLIIAFE